MIQQLTHFAIGIVYIVYFYGEVQRSRPCPLLELLRSIPREHYCHLALGILYPLSTIHA